MTFTSAYAYETGRGLARNTTLTPAAESAVVAEEVRDIRAGWVVQNFQAANCDPCGRAYTDGWIARLDEQPREDPQDDPMSHWYTGWDDADAAIKSGRRM